MRKPYIPKRFLGAFKAGHRLASRAFIDEEFSYQLLNRIISSNYCDKVAIEALDYLTKFNNEYHKAVIKKGDSEALHNTNEMYQERSNANNARNRDIMSILHHKLEPLTSTPSQNKITINAHSSEDQSHEDVMVDLLDAKNKFAR